MNSFASLGSHLLLDGWLIDVTASATIVTFALSFFGLLPTSRLRTQPRGPVQIIHLLSLPLIVVLIYVYFDALLPRAFENDRLGYIIACSLVGTFWWLMVARRAHASDHPHAVVFYVTSTVLFGFLSPLVISFNIFVLLDNVRTPPRRAPLVLGFVVHLGLYMLVFLTTRWFTGISKQSENLAEPTDAD